MDEDCSMRAVKSNECYFELFFALRAALNYSHFMRLQSSSSPSRTALTCPKCSFEQEEGPECRRCGIVFSKFRPLVPAVETPPITGTAPTTKPPTLGVLSRVFRVFP